MLLSPSFHVILFALIYGYIKSNYAVALSQPLQPSLAEFTPDPLDTPDAWRPSATYRLISRTALLPWMSRPLPSM
jgi:hypothetical protein